MIKLELEPYSLLLLMEEEREYKVDLAVDNYWK